MPAYNTTELATMTPTPPWDVPRKGKWTTEEEEFAKRLIHYFQLGLLPVPDGTTLRALVAEKLRCDPMRVTKKFAGNSRLGKKIYRQSDKGPVRPKEQKHAVEELERLEAKFLERLATGSPSDASSHRTLSSSSPNDNTRTRRHGSAGRRQRKRVVLSDDDDEDCDSEAMTTTGDEFSSAPPSPLTGSLEDDSSMQHPMATTSKKQKGRDSHDVSQSPPQHASPQRHNKRVVRNRHNSAHFADFVFPSSTHASARHQSFGHDDDDGFDDGRIHRMDASEAAYLTSRERASSTSSACSSTTGEDRKPIVTTKQAKKKAMKKRATTSSSKSNKPRAATTRRRRRGSIAEERVDGSEEDSDSRSSVTVSPPEQHEVSPRLLPLTIRVRTTHRPPMARGNATQTRPVDDAGDDDDERIRHLVSMDHDEQDETVDGFMDPASYPRHRKPNPTLISFPANALMMGAGTTQPPSPPSASWMMYQHRQQSHGPPPFAGGMLSAFDEHSPSHHHYHQPMHQHRHRRSNSANSLASSTVSEEDEREEFHTQLPPQAFAHHHQLPSPHHSQLPSSVSSQRSVRGKDVQRVMRSLVAAGHVSHQHNPPHHNPLLHQQPHGSTRPRAEEDDDEEVALIHKELGAGMMECTAIDDEDEDFQSLLAEIAHPDEGGLPPMGDDELFSTRQSNNINNNRPTDDLCDPLFLLDLDSKQQQQQSQHRLVQPPAPVSIVTNPTVASTTPFTLPNSHQTVRPLGGYMGVTSSWNPSTQVMTSAPTSPGALGAFGF